MSGSTTKKVTIDRFDRERLNGYVNPASFLLPECVELLTENGALLRVPYPEIRAVRFVKSFDEGPAEAAGQVFLTRPKSAGLWVELCYRDGSLQQGLIPNDLCQLEPLGITISPPNATGNTQRMFVPRAVLSRVLVLGVIGSPVAKGKKRRKAPPAAPGQIDLFESPQPWEDRDLFSNLSE